MSITSVFDPARDGWSFQNWGEEGTYCLGSCDFSWDLYRETYLGINPTQDYLEAPLDCAFYEIFKGCAKNGNCGGLSLLALGLFKNGGYMGFCSPASFYAALPGGQKAPSRDDLHRAINVLQARQFSAPGVVNFLNVVSAGNLLNADAAFNKVKAQLGNGDYAVLSISKGTLGEGAHTIIPYEVDEHPPGQPVGTKVIWVWNSNFPYEYSADHYTKQENRILIRSAFDWDYLDYSGSNNGWCFAIPMSIVMHKARQPMTLDMLFKGIVTIFVSGPAAALTQIEDDHGRRLYAADSDSHLTCDEFEPDAVRRLPDCMRWPWYAQAEAAAMPGELYFLRRPIGSSALNLSVRGKSYRLMYAQAGNLIEVEGSSANRARDVVRIEGAATPLQSVEIRTEAAARTVHASQLRVWANGAGWRSIQAQNARLSRNTLALRATGDLDALEGSTPKGGVHFDVDLKEYRDAKLYARTAGTQTTALNRTLRLAPADWNRLETTDLRIETFGQRPRTGA